MLPLAGVARPAACRSEITQGRFIMRKLFLAVCLVSVAMCAESLAGEVASETLPAPTANRRTVRVQSAVPINSPSGYIVSPGGSGAIDPYCRRYRPYALRTPHYEPNYGATHGWGFPGGRWDPSLPRD
jgi:hypothetical protein